MKKFGLIGYPLGHSFSKKYFSEKFERNGLIDHQYDLFEMEDVSQFKRLWQDPELIGINVTVPHKQSVIPFLNHLDTSASKVGAVNVIKREGMELVGYNSDYHGFRLSLEAFLKGTIIKNALILGTGGAAKAVRVALTDMNISYREVSRDAAKTGLTYDDIVKEPAILSAYQLIINATPLGTYPNVDKCPPLPYEYMHNGHYLFDLVYNPGETMFMKKGLTHGASVKNGLQMLQLQAEKAWEIWNGN